MQGIRGLTRYYNEHPGLHVLVSGHTDPTGDDQYNLDLSNERGQSVADFLTDTIEGWLAWHSNGSASKRWGVREDQYMPSTLEDDAGPYYTGPIDGQAGPGTQDAVRRFQTTRGLAVDGLGGPRRDARSSPSTCSRTRRRCRRERPSRFTAAASFIPPSPATTPT